MRRIGVTVIFFVLSIGMLVNVIFLKDTNNLTDETTIEKSGTIEYVNQVIQSDDMYLEIKIKEFNTKLYISPNICAEIEPDNLNLLEKDQEIFFRIENIWKEEFEEISFVKIVSLRTLEKDVFSLEDYNQWISSDANIAKIAGIVVAVIFTLIAIYNWVHYKRLKLKK